MNISQKTTYISAVFAAALMVLAPSALCAWGEGYEIHDDLINQDFIPNDSFNISNTILSGDDDGSTITLSVDDLAIDKKGTGDKSKYNLFVLNPDPSLEYSLAIDGQTLDMLNDNSTGTIEFKGITPSAKCILYAKSTDGSNLVNLNISFTLPDENFELIGSKSTSDSESASDFLNISHEESNVQVMSPVLNQKYGLKNLGTGETDWKTYSSSDQLMMFDTDNESSYMLFTRADLGNTPTVSSLPIFISAYSDMPSLNDLIFALDGDYVTKVTFPVSENKCYAVIDGGGIILCNGGDWIHSESNGTQSVDGLTPSAYYMIIVADEAYISSINPELVVGTYFEAPDMSDQSDESPEDNDPNQGESEDSGNEGGNTPTNPKPIFPSNPVVDPDKTEESVVPSIVPDSNGCVELEISEKYAEELLKEVSVSVVILDSSEVEGNVLSASIDTSSIKNLLNEIENQGLDVYDATLILTHGRVSMTLNVLSSICETSGKLEIGIKEVDASTLTLEQQELIGSSVIYDVCIKVNNQDIETLGSQSISVSLPYHLKTGEDPGTLNITVLKNDTHETTDCAYSDSEVIFNTNAAGLFAVTHEKEEVILEPTVEKEKDYTLYYFLAFVAVIAIAVGIILLCCKKKK